MNNSITLDTIVEDALADVDHALRGQYQCLREGDRGPRFSLSHAAQEHAESDSYHALKRSEDPFIVLWLERLERARYSLYHHFNVGHYVWEGLRKLTIQEVCDINEMLKEFELELDEFRKGLSNA